MLHLLPLEPLEQRYTVQWARWFPAEFDRLRVKWRQVPGHALTSRVEVGSVLDAYGTNYWKMTQLAALISDWKESIVKDGDTIFITDLWYPGLEALAYIRSITGERVHVAGILHDGTWDPYDFTVRWGMRQWAPEIEAGWFRIFGLVFVGSQFHKDLICSYIPQTPADKIKATGLPFYAKELWPYAEGVTSVQQVIFPHRPDPEKRPEMFADLAERLGELATFVRSQPRVWSKTVYYAELARSKVAVSFALLECFGYAMLEAAALGCRVVVPQRLSYPELFPTCYKDDAEVDSAVVDALQEDPLSLEAAYAHYGLARHEGAIERMVNWMQTAFGLEHEER